MTMFVDLKPRVKYEATKTDIKGIERWLRRTSDHQKVFCPFDKKGFHLPHWKCYNIFGNKILDAHFSHTFIDCPCYRLKLENVIRTAKRIVQRWNRC
jgi:hypothetical protein